MGSYASGTVSGGLGGLGGSGGNGSNGGNGGPGSNSYRDAQPGTDGCDNYGQNCSGGTSAGNGYDGGQGGSGGSGGRGGNGGLGGTIGGLTGANAGSIANSYAMGSVSGSAGGLGGLGGASGSGGGGGGGGSGGMGAGSYSDGSSGNSGSYGGRGNSGRTGIDGSSSSVGGLVGYNQGIVSNSHYDIDSVLVSGITGSYVTLGGIYTTQYQDWINHGLTLSVGDYLQGSGNSYTLNSVQDLKNLLGFADNAAYRFTLSSDVNLQNDANLWIPYLAGSFDGAKHNITNLHLNQHSSMLGLFGQLMGSISNLNLQNVSVSGNAMVGGLVGDNRGTISNSSVTGSVNGTGMKVGGLAGSNSGTLDDSYAIVAVNSSSTNAGGLVGENTGTISNTYASGSVNGVSYTGGLVGSNAGHIYTSYANGRVSTSTGDYEGGLVGFGNSGNTSNSYWDTAASNQPGSNGGSGISSAAMQLKNSFSNFDIANSGGSTSIWRIYEGQTTPLLRSFLTPITLTMAYDGTGQTLSDVSAYTSSIDSPNTAKLINAGTLTLSSTATAGSYTAALNVISNQQGYDISLSNRTLTGSGSAANDLVIPNSLSWSAGKLILNAQHNIVLNANLNASGSASLALLYGQSAVNANNSYTYTRNAQINLPAGQNFSTQLGSNVAATTYTVITDLGVAADATNAPSTMTLQGIAQGLAGKYVLGADIDACATGGCGTLSNAWNSGAGFTAIGNPSFTGVFDGLGHDISNLYISSNQGYKGLFATTGAAAIIRNVTLSGVNISGGSYVGALVGENNGLISNSYVNSAALTGIINVGGLVGNNEGTVSNSHYNVDAVTINGSHLLSLGGLYNGQFADWVANGLTLNIANYSSLTHGSGFNYTIGEVQGLKDMLGFSDNSVYTFTLTNDISLPAYYYIPRFAGTFDGAGYTVSNLSLNQANDNLGLFGIAMSGSQIKNVAMTNASVSGNDNIGALVGKNQGSVSGSHAAGTVSGNNNVGGLVGKNGSVALSNSYVSDISVTGATAVGGLVGNNDDTVGLGSITGSHVSNATVTGSSSVGGLVGSNGKSGSGAIGNSYVSSAAVTGSSDTDVMVGLNNGTLANTHYAIDAVSVNGNYLLTQGGLYNVDGGAGHPAQFSDWLSHSLTLNIADYSAFSGSGTSYTLNSAQGMKDLLGFAEKANYSFTLTGNIVMPAGLYIPSFAGTFDGAGHTISNLSLNLSTRDNLGLFGVAESGSIIRNLGLIDASVTGKHIVGTLVGSNHGTVSNSYATGSASGVLFVGGLVGVNYGTVDNSYATASAGGFITGGLVGRNKGVISNSYSTGVSASGGGLVGDSLGGTVSNSFWDVTTSGKATSQGGIGMTTQQMMTLANFTSSTDANGNVDPAPNWDFNDTWYMVDGSTRPFLRMEHSTTITNAHQLQLMNMDLSANYTLANNLDLAAELANPHGMWGTASDTLATGITSGFASIGSPDAKFTGNFDGQGNTITNLRLNRPSAIAVGLFGYAGSSAAISNVGLVNVSVTGDSSVGALVGENHGSISNSHAAGSVTGNTSVGGLAGSNQNNATISNSYVSTGSVTGSNSVGGLVGVNNGTVSNSHYNVDAVTLNGNHLLSLGGLYNDVNSLNGVGQFSDWLAQELSLDMANYPSLSHVSGNTYTLNSVQGIKDLLGFSDRAGYTFTLTDDINLSSALGLYIPYLAGTFNGAHHTISNLSLSQTFNDQLGLFGQSSADAQINNLTLSSASVTGSHFIGVLVGENGGTISGSTAAGSVSGDNNLGGLVGVNNGTIDNSTATTSITMGAQNSHLNLGGLAGLNNGTISNSSASGSVSGSQAIGGLVGQNNGLISNSAAVGSVSGANYAGGLVGVNMGTISSSHASGSVSDTHNIGGLVGQNYGSISNSYATGSVSGTLNIGGLVGQNYGSISNSYATGSVSGTTNIGGLVGRSIGTIADSHATGSVSGSLYGDTAIGGLAGENGGIVSNSYASGSVMGSQSVGGLVGNNSGSGAINDSYATGNVSGTLNTGGLAGINEGTISNSTAGGSVSGASYIGGLVGLNHASISDSYATGHVTGTQGDSQMIGGLVGDNNYGSISNSYSTGAVVGVNAIGGLVGRNYYGSISNSYTTGSVVGTVMIGGLVGWNYGSISNSYATGSVSGTSGVGGLVGVNNSGTVSDSFWDKTTTGQTNSDGGTGMITLEMMKLANFTSRTDANGYAVDTAPGWNFDGTWYMVNGSTRPFLRMEHSTTITNAHQLQLIGLDLNATYTLANNLDLAAELANPSGMWATSGVSSGFVPLGSLANKFNGIFEGQGYDIANLHIAFNPDMGWVGLYAATGVDAIVRNVSLTGGSVSGGSYTGALVGGNYGTISNSFASSNVSGVIAVGGLSGKNSGHIIDSNVSAGSVTGTTNVGGLVGANSGTLSNSHYNIDALTLNGSHQVSLGGLYNGQFADWLANGRTLDIAHYASLNHLSGDSYTIGNAQGLKDMLGFSENSAYTFTLTDNIALPANYYIPRFAGTFDGAGYTVSNLSLNQPNDNLGLFGTAMTGAHISNVALSSVSVAGHDNIGALVGNNQGSVSSSHASGTVSGNNNVGGLVGLNGSVALNGSSVSDISVTGYNAVGGLLGNSSSGDIHTSHVSNATVTGEGQVGGLAGNMGNNGSTITDSYVSSAAVTGSSDTGALLGLNNGTLTNTHYAIDAVTVNGEKLISPGALYNVDGGAGHPAQFSDWVSHGLTLNIADYSAFGGSGTSYTLNSAQGMKDLLGFADKVNFSFTLTGNIALPTGFYVPTFAGTFDGAGHTLANLSINMPTIDNMGLFGVVASGSSIRNLGLINASVTGHILVGGLVGLNHGTVSNSYVTGSVSGYEGVGGLVGVSDGVVNNSYATGSVNGTVMVGGLVGLNYGTVEQSYSTANTSAFAYVGGLVGINLGEVSNSYATGSVSGNLAAGGLVAGNQGTVSNSYATGYVSGAGSVGGLVGDSLGGIVNNSFWDMTSSGQATSQGGKGMHTVDMMTQANFTSATTANGYTDPATPGWNFSDTWYMVDGSTRPFLRMEHSTTITNAHQLQLMGMDLSANYTLANNLDLAAELANPSGMWGTASDTVLTGITTGFAPVGSFSHPFTGSFDGQSHTISNLTINRPATNYVGLFAAASSGFNISNVGLVNAQVTGNGTVGGLLGGNYGGTLSNSYLTGKVNGFNKVGGLSGVNYGTLTNSYATGSVSGSSYVGGLLGWNSGTVSNSFATGSVSGTAHLGGLSGINYSGANYPVGTVSNSFWHSQTNTNGAGFVDDSNLSSENMMHKASFIGWDMANTGGSSAVWRLYEGHTTPLLASFLTPLTLGVDTSTTYDGSSHSGATYTLVDQLLGSAASGINAGTYTGYYSTQQGYDLIGGNLTIGKASLTLGTSDVTKSYDGTLSASGTAVVLSGLLYNNAGNSNIKDSLSGGSFAFTDKNAGGNKHVTTSGVTVNDNNSGGNYNVSYSDNTTSTIQQASLSLTPVTDSKTYDGTTTSSAVVTVVGKAAGDTVTVAEQYGSKNVMGTLGSTLSIKAGFTILDASNVDMSGNYIISSNGTASGTISKAALTVTANAVARNYDGTLLATGSGTVGTLAGAGDSVNSAGSQTFLDKNAGNGNKVVRASGVTIKDLSNADMSGNYNISYLDNNTSSIYQLASVTWTGASGNWSVASNWSNGLVPDYANVAAVTIPSGKTVTYNSSVLGNTVLTSLTNSGSLIMTGGNLTSGSITTGGFQQTGGTLAVSGNLAITSTSGAVTLGNITAGSLNISSKAGAISQTVATSLNVTGAANLSADNLLGTKYGIALANATNSFGGVVTATGSNINLTDSYAGGITLGNTLATGNLAISSKAGDIVQNAGATVKVTSLTNLTADNGLTGVNNHKYNINLANAGNDFVGVVAANGGNIALVDSIGTFYLGNITASGSLTATATAGFLMQPSLTLVNVSGTTNLTADNGLSGAGNVKYNVSLVQPGDHFGGAVSATGLNIALLNTSGNLLLGAMTATNSLAVTATAGTISQSGATTLNVTGASQFTADNGLTGVSDVKNAITLVNANHFGGYVTSNGSNISLLNNTGNLVLGNTTAVGSLTATALAGVITQLPTASVNVTGATNLTASNNGLSSGTTKYAITLANTTNNFGGTVTAIGSAISLFDAGVLTAILNSTGATTLGSSNAGQMTLSGSVGTTLKITAAGVVKKTGTLTVKGTSIVSNTANANVIVNNGAALIQ